MLLTAAAVLASWVSVKVAARLKGGTLQTAFSGLLVLVAGYTAWQAIPNFSDPSHPNKINRPRSTNQKHPTEGKSCADQSPARSAVRPPGPAAANTSTRSWRGSRRPSAARVMPTNPAAADC
ncbi:hypothetical protein GCM10027613_05490 [Microlunatus endophyticus]